VPARVSARAAGHASLHALRRTGLAVRRRASAPGCRVRVALAKGGGAYVAKTVTLGTTATIVRVRLPRGRGRASQRLILTATAPGRRVRASVTPTR
jgi:hypothetical protein